MMVNKIFKEFALLTAMAVGILYFLAFRFLPVLSPYKASAESFTSSVMPFFIFLMLFLSFTAVSPLDVKPSKWHLYHILFQLGVSTLLLFLFIPLDTKIASALYVSFICPTAVASSVITDKLKGNVASLVSYVIVINFVVSISIPVVLPVISTDSSVPFFSMVWTIMKKIFPLLVLPIISAWLVRWLLPSVHSFLYSIRGTSFYIWAFSIILLTAQILDSLFADGTLSFVEILIMLCSLLACLLQFFFGRWFGGKQGSDSISARQALGQKNTIFAIWLATSFLDPVVAVAPGSYVIWQNIMNSIELHRKGK